jgi:hypothetical protein
MFKAIKDFWNDSSAYDKVFTFVLLGFVFPITVMAFCVTWFMFFSMIRSFF